MARLTRFGTILLLCSVTACVVPPPVPAQVPFVAVPGPTKTAAQFHQDDTTCRAAAVQLPAEPAAAHSAGVSGDQAPLPMVPPGVSYLRCMEVRNNVIEPLAEAAPPVYAYYPSYPVYYRYGYPWAYPVYAFGFGYGFGYGRGYYGGYYGGRFDGYRYGFRDGGYHGGFGGGYRGGFGHR